MPKSKNKKWGFDVRNIDKRVRPQDDFFQFANGGWFKRNPIPADESRWGSFYILRKNSSKALHNILEHSKRQKAVNGSNLQKIRDYYFSGMDLKSRNSENSKPLKVFFDQIEALKTKKDIIRLSGKFRALGIGSLWRIGADQDMKDRNIVRLYVEQGGLGLPDRDYYLKKDKKSKDIRKKYIEYIGKLHRLIFKKSAPLNFITSVMNIETRLAQASMTRVELRDLEKQYNKTNFRKLSLTYNEIAWVEYFEEVNAPKDGAIIVSQPLFLKEIDKMLKDIPIHVWKNYFMWKVMNAFPGYLSEALGKARFAFYGNILSGIKKMKPQWERTTMEIDWGMGEALGELYVKKYFPENAKREINQLVDNLMAAYNERIKSRDWMTKATREKALDKLGAYMRKLGYPDKWKNYGKLKITPDSYLQNHINAYKFEFDRELGKIGKRPDRKEWGMTPPTVNAYNNYLFNEIVFPAGIIQPPFFDPEADDAVNYGGIGAIIGHELTHGFDDKGSTFDKNGEMKNWWTKKDKKLFDKKAAGLVKQYNAFEVLPGLTINGKLTLGENIADLGGLVLAYYAYKKSLNGKNGEIIGGFTPEQRFFLGAAHAECGMSREASLRLQIATDPHSPSKARVNLAFSNMVEFIEAFGVKKGDKMWRPKEKRVTIW